MLLYWAVTCLFVDWVNWSKRITWYLLGCHTGIRMGVGRKLSVYYEQSWYNTVCWFSIREWRLSVCMTYSQISRSEFVYLHGAKLSLLIVYSGSSSMMMSCPDVRRMRRLNKILVGMMMILQFANLQTLTCWFIFENLTSVSWCVSCFFFCFSFKFWVCMVLLQ